VISRHKKRAKKARVDLKVHIRHMKVKMNHLFQSVSALPEMGGNGEHTQPRNIQLRSSVRPCYPHT